MLQAAAAQREIEEWHEGLREYPDLSLAPKLRKKIYKRRAKEIKGLVVSRQQGLQVLHLSENEVRP